MSVKDYIEKTKTKPEDEKKRVVFMWTIAIIVLIFLVWAISFSLSIANNQDDSARLRAEAEVTARAQIVKSTTSPAQNIGSWRARLRQFILDGASAINEGFWTVGSWLHK